jgi:predicted nucleotidyltransferase
MTAQLHPQAAAFAREVVDTVDALTPVIEAFALGSAATGAFDPATSDLDLTLVVERPLGDRRAELVARLRELEQRFRNLELVAYVAGSEPPDYDLNVSHGQEQTGEERFWFVLDAALGQERGVPVLGRHEWGELFAAVERDRVEAAMRESLAWAERQPATNGFARLHAIRARRYLEDGLWLSKAEAREEAGR